MTHTVEWSTRTEKQFAKLDRQVANALVRFMGERVHQVTDPRSIGKQLMASDFWRYRVGDYRILCHIKDERLVVLVVELGHRREVYRR